jgi:hypothetical protein
VTPLDTSTLSVVALGVAAPLALARLRTLDRWPQLAAYLWVAAATGALGAVLLAGLLLLVPTARLGIGLADLLGTCVMAVRAALDVPRGGSSAWVGLALLGVVLVGLVLGGWSVGRRARGLRRLHRDLLTFAGRTEPGPPGVTVLDHPVALAYCLPGRDGPVVLSSAALERLEPRHLDAVVAHERAHQAGRHHGLLLVAGVLRVGFPWLPAARMGRPAVGRLVELAADDVAARSHGGGEVAEALVRLGDAPTPEAVLGAGGVTVIERIGRLLGPAPRRAGLALLAGVLLVVLPVVVQVVALVGPLARVAGVASCPLP